MLAFSASNALQTLRRAALASFALFLPVAVSAQTIASITPATVTAGKGVLSQVTIVGTGLAGPSSVMLNGASLKIISSSATAIVAQVPTAASTGKVVVKIGASSAVSPGQLGVTRSSSGTTFPLVSSRFNGLRVASAVLGGNYGTNPLYYSTPAVADFTNAGRADLLVGNANGNIELWVQSAVNSGTYTKSTNLKLSSTGTPDIKVANFAKPVVTDLDGNGLLDLIVGTGDNRHLARYEQSAANATTFVDRSNLQLATGDLVTNGLFPRPSFTDLDGNGRLDMLVGDQTGYIKRYEASSVNGTTFVADAGNLQVAGVDLKADGTATNGTAKPLVFDLDGNGLLDLIMGSQLGAVTRYEQVSRYSLGFVSKGNLSTGNADINMGASGVSEGGYAAPLITDIDGDGQLDILIGNANGYVYRYEQAVVAAFAASPLPVVLSAFGGQATSTGNRLTWATAQEFKSASFVVEASASGTDFVAVATLAAAGTSTSPRSYEYLDASATAQAAGRRYYRLRQVDQDGTIAYSAVVTVNRTSAVATATAEAFPNPFAESLSVALPGSYEPQATAVSLSTLAGSPVYAATLQLSAAPQALVALPALAPGVYVLRLTTATGTITRKVTRQ